MPKDYAHRSHGNSKKGSAKKKPAASRNRHNSSRRSIWIALSFIIVLVAALVGSLLFIQHRYHGFNFHASLKNQEIGAPVTSVKKQAVEKAKQQQTEESPPIKFDFYETLPNMNVDMSEEKKELPSSALLMNHQDSTQYVLQLASLNSQESASVFQAEVSKKGFRTKILPIVRGQTTWYRIQMGPFSNEQSAKKQQATLQEKKIPSILVFG